MRVFSMVLTLVGLVFIILALRYNCMYMAEGCNASLFARHIFYRIGMVSIVFGLFSWMISYTKFAAKCKCPKKK